jgi:hypothetical protein
VRTSSFVRCRGERLQVPWNVIPQRHVAQHTGDGICHQQLPQPRRCNRGRGCRRSRCEHAVHMAAKQGRLGRSGAGGKRGCDLLHKASHGVICKSQRMVQIGIVRNHITMHVMNIAYGSLVCTTMKRSEPVSPLNF